MWSTTCFRVISAVVFNRFCNLSDDTPDNSLGVSLSSSPSVNNLIDIHAIYLEVQITAIINDSQRKRALWFIHTTRDRERSWWREWDWHQWVLIYCTVMFTLIQEKERDQDPLFVLCWPGSLNLLRFHSHAM